MLMEFSLCAAKHPSGLQRLRTTDLLRARRDRQFFWGRRAGKHHAGGVIEDDQAERPQVHRGSHLDHRDEPRDPLPPTRPAGHSNKGLAFLILKRKNLGTPLGAAARPLPRQAGRS